MIPEEAEARIIDVDFLGEDRQYKTEQNYAKNLHQKHRQGAVVVTGRDPQKRESKAQNGQNCPQGVLLLQKTVEGLSVSAVPHAKGKGNGGIVPPESVGAKTAEAIQAIHDCNVQNRGGGDSGEGIPLRQKPKRQIKHTVKQKNHRHVPQMQSYEGAKNIAKGGVQILSHAVDQTIEYVDHVIGKEHRQNPSTEESTQIVGLFIGTADQPVAGDEEERADGDESHVLKHDQRTEFRRQIGAQMVEQDGEGKYTLEGAGLLPGKRDFMKLSAVGDLYSWEHAQSEK